MDDSKAAKAVEESTALITASQILTAQVFTRSVKAKVDAGLAAWERIKAGNTWDDWMLIGAAIEAARAAFMQRLGFPNPVGAKWNRVWTPWLKTTGLYEIDKSTRSCLQKCMEKRRLIEAWRAEQTLEKRAGLNHPTALWRHYKGTEDDDEEETEKRPNLKDQEIARLQEENDDLHDEVEALREATGWDTETPEVIGERFVRELLTRYPSQALAILAGMAALAEQILQSREPKTLPPPQFDDAPQP